MVWIVLALIALGVSPGRSLLRQPSTDLVRIAAYDYNTKGHRVVYVEQRGQNEEPQAQYLYLPMYHPVPAPKPVIVPPAPPPLNIIDVPAPLTAPSLKAQSLPNDIPPHQAAAPASPMLNPGLQVQPVPNIVPVPGAAGVQGAVPQQFHAPAPMFPYGSLGNTNPRFKRQLIHPPGTVMSPPVICHQVYTVPSSAQLLASRDTDLFACEIQSTVMTGTFKVMNDNTAMCFLNYDAVKFEGKFSHTRLCE